jgi:uncharacterized protein YndB with AHSA1/START domain
VLDQHRRVIEPGLIALTRLLLFTLDMYSPWGMQELQVLAVEPGRLLSCAFAPGTLDTTLTWRIQPAGSGARLVMEHTGFDLASATGRAAFDGMRSYWPEALARMRAVLEADPPVRSRNARQAVLAR